MSWIVSPEWHRDVVFIAACGPSFAKVAVDKLRFKGRVIAINDSYQKIPWADVLYAGDEKFLREHESKILATFKGKYVITLDNILPGVKTLKNTGKLGLELDPGGLRHGNNSGYAAINLAYHFGATKIVLLGYDMSTPDGQLHWQARTANQTEWGFNQTLNIMLPCFSTLVQPLWELGVSVVNCTPRSELKCWPYKTLYEVIHHIKDEKFWHDIRVSVMLQERR